jgi:hypothetical protein
MTAVASATRSTHHALKEWAVAVAALRAREALVTVRKGGIREDAREFRLEHKRFVFLPTYEHQNPAQVQPRFVERLEAVAGAAPPSDVVRIDTWAEVTDVIEVSEEDQVRRLGEFYVFSEAYALERLHWRPKKPLHVLVLRVYRLPVAAELPLLAKYGGCKSWIELAEQVSLSEADPALPDPSFTEARARVLAALEPE